MITVAFVTFGCKVNYSETSFIKNQLLSEGFNEVKLDGEPDVIFVNTCTVTNNADIECLRTIKSIADKYPESDIIVTGCYAQIRYNDIKKIKGVKAIFGNQDKFQIVDYIKSLGNRKEQCIEVSDIRSCCQFNSAMSYNDRTRSFLKIQDGCDFWCSYCAIPMARGKSRSDTIEHIVDNVDFLNKKGIKEIVITGVNVGDYGIINNKRECTLYDLLVTLEALNNDIRYRISSIELNLLTDQIVEFINKSKRFVKHFHIPLQSGSDKILKLMRRRYTTDEYKDKVLKIKKLMPMCCIGADVIVGFPGEDADSFKETNELLKSLPVSYLHVFPYSERDNTLATHLDNKVDKKEKDKRVKILRDLSDVKKKCFYENNIGNVVEVLFERQVDDNGYIYGYSDNYIRVRHEYNTNIIDDIVPIKISRVDNLIACGEL